MRRTDIPPFPNQTPSIRVSHDHRLGRTIALPRENRMFIKIHQIAFPHFANKLLVGGMLLVIATLPVKAVNWQGDGDQFGFKIRGATGYGDSLVVPPTINGYTIDFIDDNAFSGASLRRLIIQAERVRFMKHCFRNCHQLEYVALPASYTVYTSSSSKPSFAGCDHIREVDGAGGLPLWNVFPASRTTIETTRIRSGSRTICEYFASSVLNLTSVTIPEGVEEIKREAFCWCESLPSIELPSTLKIIGPWAFEGCTSLETIRVPDGVASIGDNAFSSCDHLVAISLPDRLTSIEYSLFNGCDMLRSVNIPSATQTIGDWAFQECGSLTTLVFPEGLQEIGQEAFRNCRQLAAPILPASLRIIGPWAFEGCMGFQTLVLPNGIETIGDGAFTDCTGLEMLVLPAEVSTIGDDLFVGCTRLKTVVLPARLRGNIDWLGIPDGCDVLFHGDPDLAIITETGFDALAPSSYRRLYGRNGTEFTRFLQASTVPDPDNPLVRHVLTGWEVSGAISASGTGTNAVFTPSGNAWLDWRWRTDVWVDVSVASGGSCDFSPRWVERGTTVRIPLSPDDAVFDAVFAGNASGVRIEGSTLVFDANGPRTLSMILRPRPDFPLTVASAYGTPSPAVGTTLFYRDDVVSATVVPPEPSRGYSWTCTGWRGTGSAPASGTGTNVVFTITKASSLTWLWQTNVFVGVEAEGDVRLTTPVWGWRPLGSTVVARYAPLSDYAIWTLEGDTNGVVWNCAARTITIPCNHPRSLGLIAHAITLDGALGANGLAWTTSGAAPWFPQPDATASDGLVARSGSVPGGGSVLETTLDGPGTLTWAWRLDATGAGTCGVDVLLDDDFVLYVMDPCGWTDASLAISGDGAHTVRFEFWDADDGSAFAEIDAVAWSGATAGGDATTGTEVPVPFDWLDDYGLAQDGDYEAAAAGTAANGRPVWECYVAGLDPTDPDDDFRVFIEIRDGAPVITFDPDLNDGGLLSERVYEVQGTTDLGAPWGPTNALSRFFRVTVRMKEDGK